MNCRLCGAELRRTFVNFGEMPLANAYLDSQTQPEATFPLHARVCADCLLVQADAVVPPEGIFNEYAFFSSYSQSWIEHCRIYAKDMTERFAPGRVVEVASNDGVLLRQFPDAVEVLGVEPAANVAEVAEAAGVPTVCEFFGSRVAAEIPPADLLVANNVMGHVPDLNDFIRGLAVALRPEGVLTVEFPHLLNLVNECQYDTIYHEHFNYLSLASAERAFARHGLRVFDADQLPVHGGSLRLFVCHLDAQHKESAAVKMLRRLEKAYGLSHSGSRAYATFPRRVAMNITALRAFFVRYVMAPEKTIAGAGAPAKGNTLLNAAGITPRALPFVTDTSPHKQGRFLPGSRIPILSPEAMREHRPDYVLVLAWNWLDEVMASMPEVREWGGRFVVPIPQLRVVA